MTRRELQALAKAHSVRANMKSVDIARELAGLGVTPKPLSSSLSASSSSLSSSPNATSTATATATSSTLSWPPRDEDDGRAAGSGNAAEWLAPEDVDPTNRRVIKMSELSSSIAAPAQSSSALGDNTGDANTYIVSGLDPDAADHLSQLPISGGLETRPDELVPHSATIVPGQTLTSDHLVWILAQNNARDISVFHAPSEFGRVDAEWYVLATGLGLRHVHSLKDAIVHAVKQTNVPGLSSSAVAGGGKRRTPEHWEVIDLNDIVVHLMTEHGRQVYDLEQLWRHGFTEEDLEMEGEEEI